MLTAGVDRSILLPADSLQPGDDMLSYEPVTRYTCQRPPRTRFRALVTLTLMVLSGYALTDHALQRRIGRETAAYNEVVRSTARVQPRVQFAPSSLRVLPAMAFPVTRAERAGAGSQHRTRMRAYVQDRLARDQRSRIDSRKSSPVFESYVSQDASTGWGTSWDNRKP